MADRRSRWTIGRNEHNGRAYLVVDGPMVEFGKPVVVEAVSDPECETEPCGRIMVGSGTDTFDPVCELPEGHRGSCKSSAAAVDQHKLRSAPTDEDVIERAAIAAYHADDHPDRPLWTTDGGDERYRAIARAVLSVHTPTGEREGCPTCGSPVRVVSGDEGTTHYEPDYRYDLLAKRPSRSSGVDAKAVREVAEEVHEQARRAGSERTVTRPTLRTWAETLDSALAGGESE